MMHPLADRVIFTCEKTGVVGVQTFDSSTCAPDASRWHRTFVVFGNSCFSRNLMSIMGGGDEIFIDVVFGLADAAICFKNSYCIGLVSTDEPVTRWHWGSVIEKGRIFDDDRITVTIPMHDRERSHWWAAEEFGDPLTIIWVRVGHRRARMSKMTTMMPTATGRKRLSTAGPARPATSIGSAAGPSILRTRGRSASPVLSLSGVVAGSAAASSVSVDSGSAGESVSVAGCSVVRQPFDHMAKGLAATDVRLR